jgi:hypothetical protein
MASITLGVPLTPPIAPQLNVDPVAAAAPVASLLAAEAELLALPASQPLGAAPSMTAEAAPDGAAMRPDQVFMARQLAWPLPDGQALAASWRALVRTYGAQLAAREQQARSGQLPGTLLMAAQDPRLLRQQELPPGIPGEAWRFTVHASGAQAQHLRVITGEADQPPGRRRRARAALRLELELADGVCVTVQVEPLPEGLVVELCAPDASELARLQALQPELDAAIARAGLRVLRWRFRDSLPAGNVHARVPSGDAAGMLTLPVFRALAELALQLPLRGDTAAA